ncbi:MAG TPA: D-amino acid aminotransferase [Gammaproteobacteria bacterium]|nr:D-amino acid aminotransferase [Gammaproteobacteria bacterium]
MAAPLRNAYLNGVFLPLTEARLSPLDRGFLFGDGVYEVIPAYAGRLFHLPAHLKRLQHSLDGIRLKNPLSSERWTSLLQELVQKNGGGDQAVYLQVSRGADVGRDHTFPAQAPATVFAMSSPLSGLSEELKSQGAKVVTLQDIRWQRCDIKCTALLGNVLLRQQAADAGCHEGILIRDGHITEGTASSLFVVEDGVLVTPPDGPELLPSITRDVVLKLAERVHLPVRRDRLPLSALERAEEVWLASSTREVYAVTRIDGQPVRDGIPGVQWKRMYALFQEHKQESSW